MTDLFQKALSGRVDQMFRKRQNYQDLKIAKWQNYQGSKFSKKAFFQKFQGAFGAATDLELKKSVFLRASIPLFFKICIAIFHFSLRASKFSLSDIRGLEGGGRLPKGGGDALSIFTESLVIIPFFEKCGRKCNKKRIFWVFEVQTSIFS